MNVIGLILIAIAVAIVHYKYSIASKNSNLSPTITIGWFVLAILLGTVGAYLSRLGTYVALLGVGGFAISLFRFGDTNMMEQVRKASLVVALSGVLAFIGGLFANPWQGAVEKEDRSHWKPIPIINTTPTDLLAMKWSAKDKNADWPVSRLMLELCKIAYKDPVDANRELAATRGNRSAEPVF